MELTILKIECHIRLGIDRTAECIIPIFSRILGILGTLDIVGRVFVEYAIDQRILSVFSKKDGTAGKGPIVR